MSKQDAPDDSKRPSLPTRVGRGLSFMNKLAFVLLVLGLLAVVLKHH
jgi:hypothetical protein